MSVLIPERSLDAWLSIYLWRRFPRLRLWAPQAGWDFGLGNLPRGKVLLLENKGCERENGTDRVVIPVQQLTNYMNHRISSSLLYYVLPYPDHASVSPAFQPRRAWTVP